MRARLVAAISSSLSDADKAFLCAIYEGEPDASALGLATVMELPAVKWKLLNLNKLKRDNPEKHATQRDALLKLLG